MALTGYYPPNGVLGGSSYGPLTQQAQGYQMGPLSQLAYQMAGSPKLGPFADAGTPPPVANMGAGATGPATGIGGDVTSALSLLGKSPKLLNTVGGLLGGSLASYGSGAAADAAVTGALGSVGAQTAGDAAAIAAGNDAALTGGGVFGATGGSGAAAAPAAAAPAASGSSSLLGAAGALAIPAAIAAAGLLTPSVSIPKQTWTDMLNTVQAGQSAGYTQGNPPSNPNAKGANGAPSWADWNNALTELQGGAYQPSNNGVLAALNAMGYPEYSQLTANGSSAGPSGHGPKVQSY